MGLYIISGFRDGLLKQLVGLFGFIIAFFVATYASKPLGKIIYSIIFSDEDYIGREHISPIAEGLSGLDYFIGMDSVISVFTFILLFIGLQIIISIFAGKLRIFNRIPIVGSFNILGGIILGALKGAVLAFILITVVSLLPQDYVGEALSRSFISQFLGNILPSLYVYLKTFFLEHYYLTGQ